MGFITKYSREIVLSFLLIGLYLIFRTTNLLGLPIFTDEAIYLRWAQIALNDANWRFISLTDGKQPMFVWAVMVLMKFIDEPLLAGRAVSVITGIFTMIGLWLLSFELFKKKEVAFFSVALYIFSPFAQVYDRMALYESMVGALVVWATYVSIILVRTLRIDVAYTVGFIIGVGALTKTNAFFSLYSLPFTLLLLQYTKKDLMKKLLRWIGLAAIVLVITQVFYMVLRLSPFFHIIEQKNNLFVLPISEWIQNPFQYSIGNGRGLLMWFYEYLTIFYTSLIVISFLFIKYFWREKIMLLLYVLFPLAGLIVLGRIVFPRYLFPMMLMLLPIASWSLYFISENIQKYLKLKGTKRYLLYAALTVLFAGYPAYISYSVIYDPVNAKIANPDNGQYVNNWTAGWGVKETVAYLQQESKSGPIFVGSNGTFGLMPASLEIYLKDNKNVTIKGYWPPEDTLPKEVLDSAKVRPTYFVLYQPQVPAIEQYPLDLVLEKKTGKAPYSFRLYKVRAQ